MEVVNQWIWGPWSFETPGNFSHSFNKQIHHIEINFEWFVPQFGTNQPCQLPLLTLRKVIPVKDYWGEKLSIGSSCSNSEWNPLTQDGSKHPHAGFLWNLFQMFIVHSSFYILIWLQASKLFFCMLDESLEHCPNCKCGHQKIVGLCEMNLIYSSCMKHSPQPSYCKWTHKLLHWFTWLALSTCFFFPEAKTFPFASKFLNMKQIYVCSMFVPSRKETSMFCMTAFAMLSAPWFGEPRRFPSKTSTPKEWVAQRGTRGVGWPLAMLNLASLQSQAVGQGQHEPNGWRYELDTRKG